jgi:hypothetical protein
MPMDVAGVIAKQKIEELERLLFNMPYGGKEEICDDIIEFVDRMKAKYPQPETDWEKRNRD